MFWLEKKENPLLYEQTDFSNTVGLLGILLILLLSGDLNTLECLKNLEKVKGVITKLATISRVWQNVADLTLSPKFKNLGSSE